MTRQAVETIQDLERTYRPVRLSEVVAISGLDRRTILGEMDRGRLKGWQLVDRPGSAWLFDPVDVLAWLRSMKNSGKGIQTSS